MSENKANEGDHHGVDRIVAIIPCGSQKREGLHRASELYTGAYFRGCLACALRLVNHREDHVFILSAKYGLLCLSDLAESYDLKMGQPGCVSPDDVHSHAIGFGLIGDGSGEEGPLIVAFGGKRYLAVCKAIWPQCLCPTAGLRGMGIQMQVMKTLTRRQLLQAEGARTITSTQADPTEGSFCQSTKPQDNYFRPR